MNIPSTTKRNLKIAGIAIMIGGAYILGYNAHIPLIVEVKENTCISRLLEGQTVNGYRLIEKKGFRHPYLKKEVADKK